jgi:hypothetical protein
VHRQSGGAAQRGGIGRQVGAFEHQGVDAGFARQQALAGREHLGLRIGGVEFGAVFEQGAVQRRARRDAFDRRGRVRADGREVRGCQRGGLDRDDAAAPARQVGKRLQRGGPDGHRQRGLQLALPARQEAATGGQRRDALAHQRGARRDEGRECRRVVAAHHRRRRRAGHDALAHRKRERRCVADVAGRAREARVEHQQAEGRGRRHGFRVGPVERPVGTAYATGLPQ